MAVVVPPSKGYDLEHIWKHVDHGPAKDAVSFTSRQAKVGRTAWLVRSGSQALGFEPGQLGAAARRPSVGQKAADLYKGPLAAEPYATGRDVGIWSWQA